MPDCGGNKAECPLGVNHPKNMKYQKGTIIPTAKMGNAISFSLGCSLCPERKMEVDDSYLDF